jgi:hypothetical protein
MKRKQPEEPSCCRRGARSCWFISWSVTCLSGCWLVLACAAWLAQAALALVVVVASLLALLAQLQKICRAATCPAWQITPTEARALQQLGDSTRGFVAGQVVRLVLIELVSFAVGAVVWASGDMETNSAKMGHFSSSTC